MRTLKLLLAGAATAAVLGLAPSAAVAQNVTAIKYYVAPNPGNPGQLFEVIDGAPGGGRLVRDGRSEVVPGPGGGTSIGYTDRASRGEPIVTRVLGSGRLDELQFRRGSQVLVRIPFVSLPTQGNRNMVSNDPSFDNLSVAAVWLNRVISQRRVPVGTRP